MNVDKLATVEEKDSKAGAGDGGPQRAGAAEPHVAEPADVEADRAAGGSEGATTTAAGTGATEAAEVEAPKAAEVEAPKAAEDGRAVAERPLLSRAPVLLAFYAVVAVVLTWPLVIHLADAMTYGAEPTTTVPLFNLWTMEWNRIQVGDLYGDYWNAPIFHPADGAFALSEPQPLTGLVFAPISWLSGNPVLGYNLVALLILTLNGYAGNRLARALGVAPGPALLAGAMAVGLPFVAHQMGVLQLTAVFPLLLLIETVLRWAPGGGAWPAARIGLWLAVTFLTCGYYGLFAVVGIGLASLVLVRRQWLSRSRLADVAIAGGTFAVLAVPILLGQAQYTSDHHRPPDLIRDLSAGAGEYWELNDETLGAAVTPWLRDTDASHGLYPGTALIVLGVAGLLLGGRRQVASGRAGAAGSSPVDERRRPWFLFAGVCLAWVLSRGLKLSVLGFQPYEVVRTVVPGYDELRSPFRFAVLGELFLLGLAAYGLDALWRWDRRVGLGRRWATRAGPVLATVVVVLGVAEVSIAPVRLFEPEPTAEWAEWLADYDDRTHGTSEEAGGPGADADAPTGQGGRPAVVYVPFPADGRVVEFRPTAERMVQSLAADLATASGYSGLFPEEYQRLADAMAGYPNEEADALLAEYGVRYIVADNRWLVRDSNHINWMATHHVEIYDDGETSIFELVA